jgi:Mg-chelatase subunit ChlD
MNTQELMEELKGLAAMVSGCPEVAVVEGVGMDDHWRFNWVERVITVNPADIRMRHPDLSRGLIAHEAGHAAITRADGVIPRELLADPLTRLIFNVVEDCRMENWLVKRWPGCSPWVALCNHQFRGSEAIFPNGTRTDPVDLFMGCILYRWWNRQTPEQVNDAVRETLDEIWPDLEEAFSLHPDPDPIRDTEAVMQQYREHPVSLCFRGLAEPKEVNAAECDIRIRQYDMFRIVHDRIIPFFRLISRRAVYCGDGFSRFRSKGIRGLLIMSDDDYDEDGLFPGGITDSDSAGEVKVAQESEQVRLEPAGESAEPDPHYAQTAARLEPMIAGLADAMQRHLEKETRMTFRTSYPSGQRITLARAMQAESDPRQFDRLWERRIIPGRPDPAFVIAADVSGSMQGERADATFEALVMMRECCLRLNIPLGIITFSSCARIAQHWMHPSRSTVFRALGLLRRRPRGSTNMAAGIVSAGAMLSEIPRRNRHLWLLSDGNPNSRNRAKQALADVSEVASTVTGIGLGPETNALKELVPGAMVNIQPEELPSLAARLFSSQALIG